MIRTDTDDAATIWNYRPKPGAGRPVRNGFTGYNEATAAALAEAIGLKLVILTPNDNAPLSVD
ncbi:hypothetical protein HUN58_02235 [Curtobacterium sp. Csp1]|uniref:hypothetical protein n=1 Tax=Curtobacterium sp. Csp1 TaxID=2495429 RepID=UPI001597AAA4|nr:hypothetical protein [Curtobacterium sp. Csp1]QKS18878.1 hypothetical protein HUN58_02235 [Curtobacterium sp. Csp1]